MSADWSGYRVPGAVFTAANSSVKVDPYDPAFSTDTSGSDDESLPAVYLFSNARGGDGIAYAMAEDGTIIGSHLCSHRGYMRHDLHDRDDGARCAAHYPDGYRLVVLMDEGSSPPDVVVERNAEQGRAAEAEASR